MRKQTKEERELRAWCYSYCRDSLDTKLFNKRIAAFRRAVQEEMWAELEPFIGLDPRHDGNPPSHDPKCKPCAEVRRIKEKYAAAIRRKGGKG